MSIDRDLREAQRTQDAQREERLLMRAGKCRFGCGRDADEGFENKADHKGCCCRRCWRTHTAVTSHGLICADCPMGPENL